VAEVEGLGGTAGRAECARFAEFSRILLIRGADSLTGADRDLRFWRNWPAENRQP
jgi:hypothetical protein